MKKIFSILIVTLAFSAVAFAQVETNEKKKASATAEDKAANFDSNGKITRGMPIGKSKLVSLDKVFKDPSKYTDKTVRVKGFVVRSCTKEGCWAELGAKKDSSDTVRVTMKDHSFFIPLKSAGFGVETEGVFKITTLSKEKVDHLINDDGAEFKKINDDGTVTEISFIASGIELSKAK